MATMLNGAAVMDAALLLIGKYILSRGCSPQAVSEEPRGALFLLYTHPFDVVVGVV